MRSIVSRCIPCRQLLLLPAVRAAEQLPCASTEHCDNDGLLYPSKEHFSFMSELENTVARVFYRQKAAYEQYPGSHARLRFQLLGT